MSDDEFDHLEAAFFEAAALTDSERAAYLVRFAMLYPALSAPLARMLEADRAGRDAPADVIAEALADFASTHTDPWIGLALGPWRIERRIGSGGMGAVFEARRDDGHFDRAVAVKVLAVQALSEHGQRRFRAERQFLADLSHPNIAALLDGGTTSFGVPYLVMELVDGIPIDRHCDEHRLSLRQRLMLIVTLCDAIDYAHRNLLVHRDIKPGNILVRRTGEPVLLDFGIAATLQDDSEAAPPDLTAFASRAMTPSYASPEQVRGERATVESDVYAIGVVLHRLLSGGSPYLVASEAPRDIETAILNDEPIAPSRVLRRMPDGGVGPGATIADDLDRIVLKCLRKEPSRRYGSARELAADIGRFLNNEPVLARPNDRGYVLGKYLRRNWQGVLAGAVSVSALVGVSLAYTVQLSAERDRARAAAAEARQRAAESEQTAAFLTALFSSASPSVAQGEAVSAVDLLRAGEVRIAELGSQPLLQARLTRTMGMSFLELGEVDEALILLERSAAALEKLPGASSRDLAESLFSLAEGQRIAGLHEASVDNRRRVVSLLTDSLGPEHPDTLFAHIRLGSSLVSAGRPAEGLEAIQVAAASLRAAGLTEDPVYLDALGVGAVAANGLGRHEEAFKMNEEALAQSERILGPQHPNTIIRLNNSAIYLHDSGNFAEALARQADGVVRGEKTWGVNHHLQTNKYVWWARHLQKLGRFDEAETVLERPRADILASEGEVSANFATYLAGLGDLHLDTGRLDAAAEAFDRAAAICRQVARGCERPAALAGMGQASVDLRRGRYELAEEGFARVLAAPERIRFEDRQRAQRELASAISFQGRHQEAAARFEALISDHVSRLGAGSPSLVPLITAAAANARRAGALDDAESLSGLAWQIAGPRLHDRDWIGAEAALERAASLEATGARDAAVTLAETALRILTRVSGDRHPGIARAEALIDPAD